VRIARIYIQFPLAEGHIIDLPEPAAIHVMKVLRLKIGDPLILFNGTGGQYDGNILSLSKKKVCIQLQKFHSIDRESPLYIHLGQAISRGDRMDVVIQKSTELGANKITPIYTEYCAIKPDPERLQKKIEHWKKISYSACEQSGRNKPPQIADIEKLAIWLKNNQNIACKFILHPHNSKKLQCTPPPIKPQIALLVGPEGGFSETEITAAQDFGFQPIKLGPRTLRTETAALTTLSILQFLWGDLS